MEKRHIHNWLAVAFILIVAIPADKIPTESTAFTFLYAINAVIDYLIYKSICVISKRFNCIEKRYIIAILSCQALMLVIHSLACGVEYLNSLYPAEWLALINDQYCNVLRAILFVELLIMLGAGDDIRIRYKHDKYGAGVFNPAIVRSDHYISNQNCHHKKTKYGYF